MHNAQEMFHTAVCSLHTVPIFLLRSLTACDSHLTTGYTAVAHLSCYSYS